MQIVSDSILMEMLQKEDTLSFEMLYSLTFTSISKYINSNSGCTEDAEDVFQETIIVFLEKIRSADFKLTSSLKTYLFAIARNIWLNRLRSKKIVLVYNVENLIEEIAAEETDQENGHGDKLEFWMQKVTRHCQWVIHSIYFLQHPIETMMKKMGLKNKHTASNQKYKCVQMLKKEMQKQSAV